MSADQRCLRVQAALDCVVFTAWLVAHPQHGDTLVLHGDVDALVEAYLEDQTGVICRLLATKVAFVDEAQAICSLVLPSWLVCFVGFGTRLVTVRQCLDVLPLLQQLAEKGV